REIERSNPPSVGRTTPLNGSISRLCKRLARADRELAEYRSIARMNPWPTSRALAAAATHVARLRRAIASSRPSIRTLLQQSNEDLLERSSSCATRELILPTEGDPAAFGEQENAVAQTLRIGHLVNARQHRCPLGSDPSHCECDVPHLQRVERAEWLIKH